MSETFQLPAGVHVSDLSGISEAYSVKQQADGYWLFTINVSAEKIAETFRRLASHVGALGFLTLEVPTHRDVEQLLRKNEAGPFHRDVHYLDGLSWEQAQDVFDQYEHLLCNDGEINFGFGAHQGHDEVFVAAYKIFHIYADDTDKYHGALRTLGFDEVPLLKTVWQNFSQESPGRRSVLGDSTPNIWQLVEQLKARGLYLAERREE